MLLERATHRLAQDAVIEVAEPFIAALPDNASDQARTDAIGLGVDVWNAVVLERRGDFAASDAIEERLRALPNAGYAAEMARLFADAARRMDERYPDDLRLVTGWTLTIRETGEASLTAGCALPPA